MDDWMRLDREPREPYSVRSCPDDGADMRMDEERGQASWVCPACGSRSD